MFFHVSVAKIMVFIQLSKPFSRIANADIQVWRIANPPELGALFSLRVLPAGGMPAGHTNAPIQSKAKGILYSLTTFLTHFCPLLSIMLTK